MLVIRAQATGIHQTKKPLNQHFSHFQINIGEMLKTEVSIRMDTSVFSISTKSPKIFFTLCFSIFLQLKNVAQRVYPCF